MFADVASNEAIYNDLQFLSWIHCFLFLQYWNVIALSAIKDKLPSS